MIDVGLRGPAGQFACWAASSSAVASRAYPAAVWVSEAPVSISMKRAPEALDLLLDDRAGVVRLDDRAQAARGRDRLESGDAGADDQHLGRRDIAGGGGQQRHELGQVIGRHQDGLVAGDGRHRRERVHVLRAGGARDRVHAEGGHALVVQRLDQIRVDHRLQEGDQGLAAAKEPDLIRRRLLDFDDQVGLLKDGGVIGHDGRAGSFIGVVEQVSRRARIRLDYDSIALGDQALDGVRHERDPSLARNDLTGNADRDGRAAATAGEERALLRSTASSTATACSGTGGDSSAGIPVGGVLSISLHSPWGVRRHTVLPSCPDRTRSKRPSGTSQGRCQPGASAGHEFELKW